MIIPRIITQHVEEAAFLSRTRALAVLRPDHRLRHLADLDERLDAHVDGLRAGGEECRRLCNELMGRSRAGACFAPALLAIQRGASGDLEGFLALSQASAVAERDVSNAFAWADAGILRGVILGLLQSADPFRRKLGVAACAMHRVDPGPRLLQWVQDEHDLLAVRALQAAAELGRLDTLAICLRLLEAEQPERRFWAAWAAVVLGSRDTALVILESISLGQEATSMVALDLLLKVLEPLRAHGILARLAQAPAAARALLKGSGTVGNPEYVPWLIHQMSQPRAARLAGEAFSTITGLDLSVVRLDRRQPEDFKPGPNDDPNDPNVEIDEDDGLPWPDQTLIQKWWNANSHCFQPGVRYFMGEPLNRENCLRVLREGFQRQRIAAALYLSLLNPGTPLFEWRAPAWRQQRLLATMT